VVAKCADCWQVARRLRAGCVSKKYDITRLVGRVAKCPQLRANCVNHQPLRPLVGYHILPMFILLTMALSLTPTITATIITTAFSTGEKL